jgi:hypothetical protein
MMTTLFRLCATLLTLLALAGSASASPLAQPGGQVILTVTGQIANSNDAEGAQFDLAMIEALPQRQTRATTPWFEGPQQFTGPLLSDLMAAVGASGSALRIVAVNDYAATMPWEDLREVPVILAVRHNGQTMSVRGKGPLFVIYPFDEYPHLRDEVYFSRSVWQVVRIEVVP